MQTFSSTAHLKRDDASYMSAEPNGNSAILSTCRYMLVVLPRCVRCCISEQRCQPLKHFLVLNMSSGEWEKLLDTILKIEHIKLDSDHMFVGSLSSAHWGQAGWDGNLETNQLGSLALWMERWAKNQWLSPWTPNTSQSPPQMWVTGPDGGTSGWQCWRQGLWGGCRPLIPWGWVSRLEFCAVVDSGLDLPGVRQLCSFPKAPTPLLSPALPLPNSWSQHYFLDSINLAPFPENSHIHGMMKKTVLLSEEPFKCKDGTSVMSGLSVGLRVWVGCEVSPAHRCAHASPLCPPRACSCPFLVSHFPLQSREA